VLCPSVAQLAWPLQNGSVRHSKCSRSFLTTKWVLLFLSEYAGSSGAPIEASRKGKGKNIPFPIEPDRQLSEAFRRRNDGSHLQHLNSDVK
jgi:hypothetical protein